MSGRKRIRAALTLAAAGLLVSASGVVAPAVAADSCPTVYWGSLSKVTSTAYTTGTVANVRSGRHACFDRLVVDLNGPAGGASARYVSKVHQQGSGTEVKLSGGAIIELQVRAPAYTSSGSSTYKPVSKVQSFDYDTFRQLGYLGSYESQTAWGLSTRARLPMRLFTLDGPNNGSRVVIDVAHQW